MAKGKSAATEKRRSGAASKRIASVSDVQDAAASAKKSRTAAPRGISPAEIGYAAGEVWGLLSRDGTLTLAAIKKSIDAPGDLVVAAIGWLAREDKLDITTTGRTVKVSLRSL